MRRRPFLYAAAALAAGILAGPLSWPFRPYLAILTAAAGLFLVLWYWWRRTLPAPVVLALLLPIGSLLVNPPLPEVLAAKVTAVRGWADGELHLRGDQAYRRCLVEAWRLGNGPWRDPGRAVRLWVGPDASLPHGATFIARGRISPWNEAETCGFFHHKDLALTGMRRGNPLTEWLRGARSAALETYRRNLDPREAALLGGLVFGDLPGLPREDLNSFRDAGGLHLLSVSGLHVGFILVLALGLGALIGWRDWRAWILGAVCVLCYAFICGLRPPVLRAVVMALTAGAGAVARRRADPGNLFGLAALAVLIWQPLSLFGLSFQMSFAATAGLIWLYPRLAAWLPEKARFLKPLLISLAATLAVLPIQAAAFGRISLIGVIANVVLVPLAGLAVQAGLVGCFLGTLLAPLAKLLLAPAGWSAWLLLTAARFFAGLPGAAVNVGAWPWPVIALYYGLLALLGHGAARNPLNRRSRWGRSRLSVLFAAALTCLVWWRILAIPADLRVTFLDVGQGDAALIQAPGGYAVLVDGGGEEAGPRVLDCLRKEGINRLDLIILSHPHGDHLGGLLEVAREMPIGLVLDPDLPDSSEAYRGFLRMLQEKGIPRRRARRGLVFTMGREARGRVLYPPPEIAEVEELNEASLVFILEYKRLSVLFPGDLEGEGEAALLNLGDDLRATVLKAGHHGSYGATSRSWLDAVRPRAAIISAGRLNSFGHPHRETLERLDEAWATVYRTDRQGTIRFVTNGIEYRIETGRQVLSRRRIRAAGQTDSASNPYPERRDEIAPGRGGIHQLSGFDP